MTLKLSTAALARGAARRPWFTIVTWLVILAAAFVVISTLLGDALTTEQHLTNYPESQQAYDLLEERLGTSEDTMDEMVIVRSATLTVDDAAYRRYLEGLFGKFMSLGEGVVAGGAHYYLTGDESLVSSNRRATIMPLMMPERAKDEIEQVHEIVREANEDGPFQVLITGEATLYSDFTQIAEETLKTGESVGISLALLILALVFGAIAAALLPLVLAIAAIILALGATALVGQVFDLSFFVTNMITMMGLAVGIDYSLFIVSRYREERRRGFTKLDAITAAGATASRAVLFSGMTVVLALGGLLIFPDSTFHSLGIGAILVVLMAVLASLTLLPALLSLLGDRIDAIRIPLVQRLGSGQAAGPDGGLWDWTAHAVMRQPVLSLLLAVGLLIGAATPYLDIKQGTSVVSAMPDDLRSKEAFGVLVEEFGFGQDVPTIVVIDGDMGSAAVQAGIQHLEGAVESDPVFVASGLETYPESDWLSCTRRWPGIRSAGRRWMR